MLKKYQEIKVYLRTFNSPLFDPLERFRGVGGYSIIVISFSR
jgi:hypothetical protein